MHGNYEDFLKGMSVFLGSYYLFIAAMNGVVALIEWTSGKDKTLVKLPFGMSITSSVAWLALSLFFLLLSPLAFSGSSKMMALISLPEFVRDGVNRAMNPTIYTLISVVAFFFLYFTRRFFANPTVAWLTLNAAMLLMGLSMTDRNFAEIVAKPDNVPIVGLVFLLGFFTWVGTNRAVANDERAKQGLPPLEKLDDEKILVWPDLVYTELICMVALTAFLIMWAILLPAPLEEPASAVKTPNPSKAPWYFLGLQEMLVYFDPWMAGVVLPSVVVGGLMAIPFLDFNKKGNGYYTIEERKFAYLIFQFGFFVLWVTLIVMGTFLRGPNWNFFGPYEIWDTHKVEVLNNKDLSEMFWIDLVGMINPNSVRPKTPENSGALWTLGYAIFRELPGIVITLFYFTALPVLFVLFSKMFREMLVKMGLVRYMVMTNLLLTMGLLPLKMVMRWAFNLKYFIFLPEYGLNF